MVHALKPVRSADDWRLLHDIRRAVLFAPNRHAVAYDESHPDDHADGNQPFLLICDGAPVGVARLDLRGDIAVVRLVAIIEAEQRRGHGRALGELLDGEARRRGVKNLRVNAAADAVSYYEKTGWVRADWDASERRGLAAGAVQMTKRLDGMT